MEHPSNFGFTCEDHAPKPRPDLYGSRPLESFVGKYVKLGFPVIPCPEDAPPQIKNMWPPFGHKEHMWVMVEKVENGELVGKVNNDPVFALEYPDGTQVAFSRDEIEMVNGEEDPRGKPKRQQ